TEARQGAHCTERGQAVTASDTHRTIDAVWRIESAKLIAGLTRMTGDVGLAEDLAQDALVAALERWPESGVPDNPGAWLMTTAKRRAIDEFRRGKLLDRKHQELGPELLIRQEHPEADLAAALDDHIGDDRLGLIFTTCHPVLSTEARVALTLRLLGGLTTDEIARAFLVPEATLAQRIVRAKRTLREAHVPFEVPRRGLRALERAERLAGALVPYTLQAAIAACHARARTGEDTDWTRITALYDALAQLTPSPIVELNRAVAYAMAFGPAAGLEIVDALTSAPARASYHLLPRVRGVFPAKPGRFAGARAAFARAAAPSR